MTPRQRHALANGVTRTTFDPAFARAFGYASGRLRSLITVNK